jgi:hypothetical protein
MIRSSISTLRGLPPIVVAGRDPAVHAQIAAMTIRGSCLTLIGTRSSRRTLVVAGCEPAMRARIVKARVVEARSPIRVGVRQ